MIARLRALLATTILGGVAVLAPLALLTLLFLWIYRGLLGLIEPLTRQVTARLETAETVAAAIVIGLILGVCFTVGLILRTQAGSLLFRLFENGLLGRIPGYRILRETFRNLFERNGKRSLGAVALIRVGEARFLGFITDRIDGKLVTVFVPTSPNPTSGLVFHLPPDQVNEINVTREDAMRVIIGCGVGSEALLTSCVGGTAAIAKAGPSPDPALP